MNSMIVNDNMASINNDRDKICSLKIAFSNFLYPVLNFDRCLLVNPPLGGFECSL